MYFHSASSRHEQYASIRKQRNQQLKQPPRMSTSSTASGTDSGYNSPTSPRLDPQVDKEQQMQIQQQLEKQQREHQLQQQQLSSHQLVDHDKYDNASTTSSIVTETTLDSGSEYSRPKKKKNRKKQYLDQSPRQPDFVYSCPRPLAFPFHNDCHFLPVAEADPRDVARISPPRRMPSMESTTTSKAGSTIGSFDQRSSCQSSTRTSTSSAQSSIRDDASTTASHHSRPASLISSVQQGTVRSLRSLFQLSKPEDSLHSRPVSPSNYSTSTNSILSERLPRLESKTGTVASLRNLFTRQSSSLSSSSLSPSSPSAPPTSSADINNTPSSTQGQPTVSRFSRSVLLAKSNKKKTLNLNDADDLTAINTVKNSQTSDKTKRLFFGRRSTVSSQHQKQENKATSKKSSKSSASASSPSSAFSISRLWPQKPLYNISTESATPIAIPSLDDLPSPPSAPPGSLPRSSSTSSVSRLDSPLPPLPPVIPQPSFSSGFKSFFSRSETNTAPEVPSSRPSAPAPITVPSSTQTQSVQLPATTTTKPARRSFFASLMRSSPSTSEASQATQAPPPSSSPSLPFSPKDNKSPQPGKDIESTNEECLPESQPTTTVGRIWKSFKRLVRGNKSSRVGVL